MSYYTEDLLVNGHRTRKHFTRGRARRFQFSIVKENQQIQFINSLKVQSIGAKNETADT